MFPKLLYEFTTIYGGFSFLKIEKVPTRVLHYTVSHNQMKQLQNTRIFEKQCDSYV